LKAAVEELKAILSSYKQLKIVFSTEQSHCFKLNAVRSD